MEGYVEKIPEFPSMNGSLTYRNEIVRYVKQTEQMKKFVSIVKNCYLKILKRKPDEIGFKHYLNLLTKGKITENDLILVMKSSIEYEDIDSMNNFIKKYDLLFTKNHTKNRLQELSKIGDRGTLNSNFFWYGKNFGFLNNITIKSHLKVGYHPKIWLSGEKPSNEYWKDIESNVTVIDVSEYFNVEEFLSFGGNLRIASDLWRFHFLYACGGYYSDLDNFVLKHFPDDDWVVCAPEEEPTLLGIGFIKCPPNSKIFLDSISSLKINWGGVNVFNESYRNAFGNTKSTHDGKLFYPYNWTECGKLFENIEIPSTAHAIHFYTGAIEKDLNEKFCDSNEEWCKNNPKTLLGQLWSLIK